MGENSNIPWTDHTFNPWYGCQKVSAACDFCYAEHLMDHRFHRVDWGPHGIRKRTSAAEWRKPVKWNAASREKKDCDLVFSLSLGDWADNHKSIDQSWRDDHWRLIRETPYLIHLLLTKRPENVPRYLPDDWGPFGYPNVWLGCTVEDQANAARALHLLEVPAIVHFVSAEPLLGAIDFTAVAAPGGRTVNLLESEGERRAVKWMIVGGESGSNFRKTETGWYRGIRDQCAAHDVPYFFKQYGGRTRREIDALGSALDGVVHREFPEERYAW